MKMIRQYDHCIDREWMALAGLAKRRAQGFNVFRQQPQPAVGKIDRKEEAPAGDEIATVFSHGPPAWRSDGFRFALPILRHLYFASASAPKIRAQERMPLWKLLRSYFSFGE